MPRQRPVRIRPGRVAEQLRMDVADILQNNLKDPRLGMVTCTLNLARSTICCNRLYSLVFLRKVGLMSWLITTFQQNNLFQDCGSTIVVKFLQFIIFLR